MNHSQPRIFFDANSGVPATSRALAKFSEVAQQTSANPSSIHQDGRDARAVIEHAKLDLAQIIGCQANELFFTSGATEANNLAIQGLIADLEQDSSTKPILVSSKAEHPSCLAYLRKLQQQGYRLILLDLDKFARFDISKFDFDENASYLVVGQWVNNETGAIQNIRELKNIAASNNVRWHCDAVQGIGKIPFDQDLLATDSFCFSGHKFGAPKGVGLVRLANPTAIEPLFWGGAQQDSIRPGTESPELAASFTTALVDCVNSQPEYHELNLKRRQQLLQLLDDSAVDYLLNTPITDSIPNTLNLSFSNIDGRMLLPALDVEKISISSGSACASGAAAASSVLMACGVNEKLAQASIRLSFVHNYSAQELEQGMGVFVKVLKALYKVANP